MRSNPGRGATKIVLGVALPDGIGFATQSDVATVVTSGTFVDGTSADGFPLVPGTNPIGFKVINTVSVSANLWNVTG